MQVDDTPLEPGRSYFYRIETAERRIKVRSIRNRLGRWFVTGVDLDQQTACTLWIDNVQALRPVHAG